MGTIIRANSNKIAYGVKELVIDTDAELATLNVSNLAVSTVVFSIESSKYFMLNTQREWKEINPFSSTNSASEILDLDAGSIDK